MKKKRKHSSVSSAKPIEKEESLLLKDRIHSDVLEKFQQKKQQWKQEEKKAEEQALTQKREEEKKREANKTFEELLNDSSLNWRTFK